MDKTVYVVRNHGDLLVESLQQEGFEVVVGNGQPEDKYLVRWTFNQNNSIRKEYIAVS